MAQLAQTAQKLAALAAPGQGQRARQGLHRGCTVLDQHVLHVVPQGRSAVGLVAYRPAAIAERIALAYQHPQIGFHIIHDSLLMVIP